MRLIKSVKKSVPDPGLTIVDCPPGTACPAVESVRGSDLCVLVTEPTPFGLHDLKLALEVTRKLKVPSVVLVNKAGLPGPDIRRFCPDAGVGVVSEIPMSREIAEAYSEGKLLVSDPVMRNIFNSTLRKIVSEVGKT